MTHSDLIPKRPGLLQGIRIVLHRELAAFFDSAIAYVYLISALVLLCSLFMNEFFLTGRLDMTPFFDTLAPVSVFLLPAVSMRLWAEDKKTRTFELWMTLPLRPGQVVLGKYFAALALYAIFLIGTLPIVFMLMRLGEPDLGRIAAAYLGALLFGGLFLSFGTFLSGLTGDQIVAFVSSVLLGFFFLFTGHPKAIAVLDGMGQDLDLGTWLADHVAALPHYENFLRGLVALPSVLWFVGLTAVFLWLNTLFVARDRT
ncbi:MAG: ABC-2 type transport system permease protein [Candidatus Paceibacteria bacterium]|jgi:ABC-2 type transport system permease protein